MSQDRKFNNHPGSILKLTQHEPSHDKILQKVKEIKEIPDKFEAKDELKNWLFSNFD